MFLSWLAQSAGVEGILQFIDAIEFGPRERHYGFVTGLYPVVIIWRQKAFVVVTMCAVRREIDAQNPTRRMSRVGQNEPNVAVSDESRATLYHDLGQ